MLTEEQVKAQMDRNTISMQTVGSRIQGYDNEISRLNTLKNQDLQELLRLDGEQRALKKILDGVI